MGVKCSVRAQFLFVFSRLQLKCDIPIGKYWGKGPMPHAVSGLWYVTLLGLIPGSLETVSVDSVSSRDSHPTHMEAAESGRRCWSPHQNSGLAWWALEDVKSIYKCLCAPVRCVPYRSSWGPDGPKNLSPESTVSHFIFITAGSFSLSTVPKQTFLLILLKKKKK